MKVLVLGGGLSGCFTAARLKHLGADPLLIFDRPGGSILHGGGWYLGWERLKKLGWDCGPKAPLMKFLKEGLAALQLQEGPFQLLDENGIRRRVDWASAAHTRPLQAPILRLDLPNTGSSFSQDLKDWGEPLSLNWPGEEFFGRSHAALATSLDREDLQHSFIRALKRALQLSPLRPGCLLSPPILGVKTHTQLHTELEAELKIPVVETLASVPSAPGLRLQKALRAWMERMEIPCHHERVLRVDIEDLSLETFNRCHKGEAIVLATGGFLGGGLDGCLPLQSWGVDAWIRDLPVDPIRAGGEWRCDGPLFRAGVATDATMQLVGPGEQRRFSGIFAVGDLLAGLDRIRDRASSGRALLSAWIAAEEILS